MYSSVGRRQRRRTKNKKRLSRSSRWGGIEAEYLDIPRNNDRSSP